MRKNIRIGVFGCWRGNAYINSLYKGEIPGARITALCDKKPERLEKALESCPKGRYAPKTFTDPEEFFASKSFDAVFLCNYFSEHAKYAVKALDLGIHVFSETMAAVTMADAVALCRAAERSKAIYLMAENYPYSKGLFEMKRVFDGGTLGKTIFCEGEYVHPMSPDESRKYHNPVDNGAHHWRRFLPATYYCSHALAPLIYVTGEQPRRVVAMTAAFSDSNIQTYHRVKTDAAGVMLISTDSGAVFRVNGSTNCAPHGNWYRVSCEKGSVETIRGAQGNVRLCYNKWSRPTEDTPTEQIYEAQWQSDAEHAEACGHSGGDYWAVRYFLEAIRGERAAFPDVYTACAMSAVAILGWRSVLNGSIAYDIPDFKCEDERKKWENDRQNPFPNDETPNNIPYSSAPAPESGEW